MCARCDGGVVNATTKNGDGHTAALHRSSVSDGINAECQAGDDGDVRQGNVFGEEACATRAVVAGFARANDCDAATRECARVAADVECKRRGGDAAQCCRKRRVTRCDERNVRLRAGVPLFRYVDGGARRDSVCGECGGKTGINKRVMRRLPCVAKRCKMPCEEEEFVRADTGNVEPRIEVGAVVVGHMHN